MMDYTEPFGEHTPALDLEADLIGIHEGMSNQDYHAGPGISFSAFKQFLKYPARYPAYLAGQAEDDDEPANDLGTLFHMASLEPELFKQSVVHIDGPMNKNPWKKEAEHAKEEGKIPVGDSDWRAIQGMLESVDKDPDASSLIRKGKREVSCYFTCPHTGLLRKFRPDTWILGSDIIGDIKTCPDATPEGVDKRLADKKMLYPYQGAWYLEGASVLMGRKVRKFAHIFVETKAPYGVGVYVLDDPSLEPCHLLIESKMRELKTCLETDIWPGPTRGAGIKTVTLPHWAFIGETV
jgi:exodeoxyribonuclease VIII